MGNFSNFRGKECKFDKGDILRVKKMPEDRCGLVFKTIPDSLHKIHQDRDIRASPLLIIVFLCKNFQTSNTSLCVKK